ncbi:MAG: J domain-containing protein [Verrucomicrobia bacterium]|nr:J domain-containing protein [Verrucomicrobiota bacterium]MCF7709200.1 J domain-containing protein [Verrucomicrobiota bacterium]
MNIDSRPTRTKAARNYKNIRTRLQKAREELDDFEKNDIPAFNKWYYSNFGTLLTELREKQKRLMELQFLIGDIHDEAMLFNITYAQAYVRVMDAVNNPEPEPLDDDDDDDDPFDSFDDEAEDSENEDEEQFFRDFQDFINHMLGDNKDGFSSEFDFHQTKKEKEEREKRNSRLKELYRNLVQKLHPDKLEKNSPEKLQYWYQVQEAYKNGDTEQLEVILAMCEIDDTGTPRNTPVSMLMQITNHFKAALKQIRSLIKEARRNPAWGFLSKKDSAQKQIMEKSIRDSIQWNLQPINRQVERYEKQINTWAEQARYFEYNEYEIKYDTAEDWY